MSRQDANAIFANTSFLYGGNAAYIEDLYAKYEADPAAVDAEWRAFFQSLKDEKADVVKGARGASWKKPNWPVRANGDLADAMFVDLGGLRAFKGSQRYAIPAGVDLKNYPSVVIWCQQFNVLISPADLASVQASR